MSNNLIIGLGGTGAKIVESFIHLCAAGIGPKEASVAFVDQDQANGNTARAMKTLRLYTEARAALRGSDNANALPLETTFLRTTLTPHQSQSKDEELSTDETALQGSLWVPHGQSQTLGSVVDYQNLRDSHADLAHVFFADTKEELRMELDAGYQGRPHIGSAALLAEMNKGDVSWKAALDELVDRGNNGPVRIFLCGSAFGGTGAATLPTLAREIRARAENIQDVAISAVLMLPYFDFRAPGANQDKNVAQSPYLRQQTRAALNYYKNLLDSEGIFKRIYMMGWDPLFPLGYHEKGQQGQINPPLVPEFYAGLAASEALTDDVTNAKENSVVAIGRSDRDAVKWSDLPGVVAGENVQENFAKLLRFAAMWKFSCGPGIRRDRERMRIKADAWYKQHFDRSFKKDKEAHKALSPVDEYTTIFLEFAALMARFSQPSGADGYFKLWEHYPIGKLKEENDPRSGVKFMDNFEDRKGDELSGLVGRLKDQPAMLGSKDILERLAHYKAKKSKDGKLDTGLTPFLTALWDVCEMNLSDEGGIE
ncbi:MAG: tubulin-like doman-containing protein [Alphaproteobacteria bacterium]